MRMKGDTDLQTLEVEKTLPRKVVEGERCNSRSFQSIESKQWGGLEENRKNRTVRMNAGVATQAKCDSKCDFAGSYAPASNNCCIKRIFFYPNTVRTRPG
jgi:hypothetical protein